MTDLFIPDVQPVVHVAKHTACHAAPIIKQGFSMLTLALTNVATAVIAAGISWYISHRGMQGIQNDLNNAKAEIEKLTHTTPAPVA